VNVDSSAVRDQLVPHAVKRQQARLSALQGVIRISVDDDDDDGTAVHSDRWRERTANDVTRSPTETLVQLDTPPLSIYLSI